MKALITALMLSFATPLSAGEPCCATGDLGLVIERATGSVLVVDRSDRAAIGRIEGLGDLSHAALTYSPDERYAYVFGRDGGLTKIDILTRSIAKRIVQGGNSIGGAISDDGKLIAVSNYEPGGVKVFDADTLDQIADIPSGAKTIGLVDVPGRRFAWATWETGEAFMADFSGPEMMLTKLGDVGANPFDAVLTEDASTYLIGLFGEKGVTAIDLWDETPEPVRFLKGLRQDRGGSAGLQDAPSSGLGLYRRAICPARRGPARTSVGGPRDIGGSRPHPNPRPAGLHHRPACLAFRLGQLRDAFE